MGYLARNISRDVRGPFALLSFTNGGWRDGTKGMGYGDAALPAFCLVCFLKFCFDKVYFALVICVLLVAVLLGK